MTYKNLAEALLAVLKEKYGDDTFKKAKVCAQCQGEGYHSPMVEQVECHQCNTLGLTAENDQPILTIVECGKLKARFMLYQFNRLNELTKSIRPIRDHKECLPDVYPEGRESVIGQQFKGD